jgi:transcription elongation GreA/GreB family factor
VYVTNRSASGFDIAENPGGNSTVDVEYRIVATPFANRAARLAPLTAVRKPVLASELVAARSFSKVKEAQEAAFARGRSAQSDAVQLRTKIAEAQAIMAHVR